jgi:hypothetical protein
MNATKTAAALLVTTAIVTFSMAGISAPLVTTYVAVDGVEYQLETFNRNGIEIYVGDDCIGNYDALCVEQPALSAKLHRAVRCHMAKL